jgi:hypothetical protein
MMALDSVCSCVYNIINVHVCTGLYDTCIMCTYMYRLVRYLYYVCNFIDYRAKQSNVNIYVQYAYYCTPSLTFHPGVVQSHGERIFRVLDLVAIISEVPHLIGD